jgi:predicted solute-binding protein
MRINASLVKHELKLQKKSARRYPAILENYDTIRRLAQMNRLLPGIRKRDYGRLLLG